MPKNKGGGEKKITSKKEVVKIVFCLIGANGRLSFKNRSKKCTCKYDQAWPWN